MNKKRVKYLLRVAILLIIGLSAGCSINPQIQPQVSVKEEPILIEDWFQTVTIPPEIGYQARGTVIEGETWTCFSPKDSRALALEILDLRKKLTLMNNRMALLYKRYYHKDHPTWKLPETIK